MPGILGRGVQMKLPMLFGVVVIILGAGPGLFGCAGGNESPPAEVEPSAAAPSPISDLYAGSPYLGELRNTVVYGEIWERPQLSKRDRSLITVAVLQALVREELSLHIPRGLDNGLTPEEISEIILHVTFYAGWPTGVQASVMAAGVFEERGLSIGPLSRAPAAARVVGERRAARGRRGLARTVDRSLQRPRSDIGSGRSGS